VGTECIHRVHEPETVERRNAHGTLVFGTNVMASKYKAEDAE